MTEASVSFAGNLTDHPEVRYTQSGIARAVFRVAVSGRREQAASCPRGSWARWRPP
jgi:single-stranded DNA-binding protein